ncbi:MAG: ATP-binding domain-containing protein, partial [Ferruginibacter sp.]|nr:ATP-binding domain-containing protein [Cytophagales bacterium]
MTAMIARHGGHEVREITSGKAHRKSRWPTPSHPRVAGSEFGTVVLPLFNQHFPMLFRSLVYTSLTRARQLAA